MIRYQMKMYMKILKLVVSRANVCMHSDVRRLVAVLLLIYVRIMGRAVSMQFIMMVNVIRMICAVTLHVR